MAKTVVILQPQFFPWLGVFEQIACCDTFVHIDDVQLPQGRSFCTRVQVKTSQGVQWMTAPVLRRNGQTIREARTDETSDWRRKHIATLHASFASYQHRDAALAIVEDAHRNGGVDLAEININAVERMSAALGLKPEFKRSSLMATSGTSDALLLSILQLEGATRYVSGMGGLAYIDHEKFERAGIECVYMDYALRPYAQANGGFTPYVTTLDAIAACGKDAASLIGAQTIPWRDALARSRV